MVGDLDADDLGPVGDQAGGREPLARKRVGDGLADDLA